MNKGDYGYMNHYKKIHFIGVFIYATIIIALLIVANVIQNEAVHLLGYAFAIVLVLPATKHAIAAFVVLRYHTLDEQSVADLDEHSKLLKNGLVLYDVTMSSEESIMYSPYMLLFEGKVYALVLNLTAKISVDTVQSYLCHILEISGFREMEITVVHNISEMNRILEQLSDTIENYDRIILENMKKQILVYNV